MKRRRIAPELEGVIVEYETPSAPEFFFDTADARYIESTWNQLNGLVPESSVMGITTNPNALAKVQCSTLKELELLIPELCALVTRIRRGNHGGIVYVQMPNSVMPRDYVFKWADFLLGLSDGVTRVGLKIPHFPYALEMAEELDALDLQVNVTGCADWATAARALAFPGISYVSVITGRMEERNIDANSHLLTLQHLPKWGHQRVIAGSMRTIKGLHSAILHDAIPTIGARVWDQVLEVFHTGKVEKGWFADLWTQMLFSQQDHHAPLVTDDNRLLSTEFFSQMDTLGMSHFAEFTTRNRS